jgi:putative addiction module killer protein
MANRKVVEYVKAGSSPFAGWFSALDAHAAAKVAVALYRLEQGNFSNVKPLGKGVSEYKIDFGPGYRIYFGQEGDELIILLGGGAKKTQVKDIQIAHRLWAECKQVKARKK